MGISGVSVLLFRCGCRFRSWKCDPDQCCRDRTESSNFRFWRGCDGSQKSWHRPASCGAGGADASGRCKTDRGSGAVSGSAGSMPVSDFGSRCSGPSFSGDSPCLCCNSEWGVFTGCFYRRYGRFLVPGTACGRFPRRIYQRSRDGYSIHGPRCC